MFGLCIDKLQEIVNKVQKKKDLIARNSCMSLFHITNVDDVVLFSYALDDMQHLMYWTHSVKTVG